MGKLLSWIAIAFAAYVIYKAFIAVQRKSQLGRSKSGDTVDPKTEAAPLVSCARCGLQLPKDEAVRAEPVRAASSREDAPASAGAARPALYFCGQAHARLGAQGER
jgi:hypothetical protein